MFDPEPVIGLPGLEYIELFNNSDQPVDLFDWSITIDKSAIHFKESIILLPQQYLLVTKSNGCPMFDSSISCVSITGLSLPNSGGSISIHSSTGKMIHGLVYDADMHSNTIKSKGGWSLEMKNIRTPCLLKSNWASSLNRTGGTPGRNSSLHELSDEELEVNIEDTYMPDSLQALINVNQGLDSFQLANTFSAVFESNAGPGVASWQITGAEQNRVQLNFSEPLVPGSIYRLIVKGLTSCIDSNEYSSVVPLGVNMPADRGDLIFNEIMFHPAVNEDEYVEIYNVSTKPIDLHSVYILRAKSAGTDDPITCSTVPASIFPGEYVVLSKVGKNIPQLFDSDKRYMRAIEDFPILPDDGAVLVLVSDAGDSIEILEYDKSWHVPLLNNDAGIALERISHNRPSTSSNWTSAAAPGYGTPGRKNSQHSTGGLIKGAISVDPLLFTPDRDGNADMLFINYELSTPSTICNASVVDMNGRTIRSLANNVVLGTSGRLSWNGYNDQHALMPTGVYIVVVDLFDLTGKKLKFRQAVTLGHRF